MEGMILKYDLKDPITFTRGGESEEGKTLEITAPLNDVWKHTSKLDSEVNKAFMSFQSSFKSPNTTQDKAESKESSGDDIAQMISMGGANMDVCFPALCAILEKTCKIEGTTAFTSGMFNKMSYRDTRSLMGSYIKFFLVSSLLS